MRVWIGFIWLTIQSSGKKLLTFEFNESGECFLQLSDYQLLINDSPPYSQSVKSKAIATA
jgi:hypothetical protein